MRKPMAAVRNKSPNLLVRDKVIERWTCTEQTNCPAGERKHPPRAVATLALRLKTSRTRVNRWLADPDAHPLDWPELQEAAAEVGGYVKVMFSVQHR